MNELERLGRNAFERVCQVAEESFDRAWAALQPLIEQMFAQLQALVILLRFVWSVLFTLYMQIRLEIELQPAFDGLAKGIAEAINRLLFGAFLFFVAGAVLALSLTIAVAIILDRNARRRHANRRGV